MTCRLRPTSVGEEQKVDCLIGISYDSSRWHCVYPYFEYPYFVYAYFGIFCRVSTPQRARDLESAQLLPNKLQLPSLALRKSCPCPARRDADKAGEMCCSEVHRRQKLSWWCEDSNLPTVEAETEIVVKYSRSRAENMLHLCPSIRMFFSSRCTELFVLLREKETTRPAFPRGNTPQPQTPISHESPRETSPSSKRSPEETQPLGEARAFRSPGPTCTMPCPSEPAACSWYVLRRLQNAWKAARRIQPPLSYVVIRGWI